MKKRIHINKHVIASNLKRGENKPPIRIKTYSQNVPASHVLVDGPSKVVYSPDKPLNCGARLWIETDSDVYADGSETAI